MVPLASAEAHYRRQAALSALVGRRALQQWRSVPAADINRWQALLPEVASLVVAGQFRAALSADPYVREALGEQGVDVDPVGRVAPAAFAGTASDGRPLVSLLDQPRISALTAIQQGASPAAALASSGSQLLAIALTQVQDAGRAAESVAITARPRVGYVRMVNPPCCQRCAILAGKWFRANAGFQRHPRCDCRHIPATEDAPGDVGTDPRALFESGQVRGLTPAEADAISDGADPSQVINARRGSSGMTTTEGTTRSGVAGRALAASGRSRRLTPDAIYASTSTREEAVAALRANGYLL